MSVREKIIRNIGCEHPKLYLSWSDLCKIELDGVAYASAFDWVELDSEVYRTVCGGFFSIYDASLEINEDDKVDNMDNILLLCNIKYDFHNKKTDVFGHEIDKKFLENAWNYAVENSLCNKPFGDAIRSLGYEPPDSEKYENWISEMYPVNIKSARKN